MFSDRSMTDSITLFLLIRKKEGYTLKTDTEINHLKSSVRPISNIQLNALLHLHLCPIYLIVSKGSYAKSLDISS